ncbi:MAG TPA: rhodanese-like domain-containing protein [Dongiaceae bacterium]|jgi:rhodanese-related sulfurtransferase
MAYAGELKPMEAWGLLNSNPAAQLIDVRTRPEWAFVGIPDLASIGRKTMLLSWQVYPSMETNAEFSAQVKKAAPATDTPLLFICRSGTRSRAAAETMTAQGYSACYNVSEGFEGTHDRERHRGRVNGWKAAGLPWVQE